MEYAASVRIIRLVTRTGNHNLIWLATARQRPQPGVAEITVISAHPAATSICLLAPSSYDSAASQAPPGCAWLVQSAKSPWLLASGELLPVSQILSRKADW